MKSAGKVKVDEATIPRFEHANEADLLGCQKRTMGLPDVQHTKNDDALADHLVEDFIRKPAEENATEVQEIEPR